MIINTRKFNKKELQYIIDRLQKENGELKTELARLDADLKYCRKYGK